MSRDLIPPDRWDIGSRPQRRPAERGPESSWHCPCFNLPCLEDKPIMSAKGLDIAPAEGKLGVLLVGLGAVGTTFIAGVEACRGGLVRPVGRVPPMGSICPGDS